MITYLFKAGLQRRPVHPRHEVVSDVEVDEVKSVLHVVVVAELLDLVVPEAQPDDGLGDEGVVEPLEQIVRDVQPLEVVLAGQEAIDVLQAIVIQPQSLGKGSKTL